MEALLFVGESRAYTGSTVSRVNISRNMGLLSNGPSRVDVVLFTGSVYNYFTSIVGKGATIVYHDKCTSSPSRRGQYPAKLKEQLN